MNVIIYCRVSSDEQAEGTSLDVQEERLTAYCDRKGYNVIDVPHREDESGKTFEKRPVIQGIMKYIRKHKGQVDKLLVLRWNRYSRDLFSACANMDTLRKLGVEVNSIEEPLDYNSSSWPTQLGLYIGMAQGDNISRSKATIDGMFYGNSGAPNGYRGPTTGFGVNQNPGFYNSLTRSIVSGGGIVASGSNAQNTQNQNQQYQQYANQYRHGFQNVPLPMHKDASCVRDYLWEYLTTYGQVRVADFYDACGDYAAHIIQQYTDNNWGWRNLDGLQVVRVPEGWILNLPEPISLK